MGVILPRYATIRYPLGSVESITMITPHAVQAFITHWEAVDLNEKAIAQSHFNALCTLLDVPPPHEADPKGQFFRFEKPLSKTGGAAGFADVWYKDRFVWEYKSKGKNLTDAYKQLLLYREDLDNPPVMVVCDITHYEVHIAYTGYPTRVEKCTNADLENKSTRDLLRNVLTNPELLRPIEQAATITEKAAGRFAEVAGFLRDRGYAANHVSHFFMKVLFALFAEDIHILPAELMSQSLKQSILNPQQFPDRARALFATMRSGGYFGMDRVPQFNGWLFNDDEVLPLNANELQFLGDAARLDWSAVEPSIFGTLFERSLDPTKRAQLGAHYTSRDDILLIVRPVLMEPLYREWAQVKVGIEALRAQWEPATGNARQKLQLVATGMILQMMERLASIKVLDPACGSGNFLYVALSELKNLEKAVWTYAGGIGLPQPELSVSPAQLFGIEKNPFAAELAQVVVWIGYFQWLYNEGFLAAQPKEPILQNFYTIECKDAILAFDAEGKPVEPTWPEADVIVGNPPFLGGNKIRKELGDSYVDVLFKLYEGRISAFSDLVCYWFERSHSCLVNTKIKRVGLISTNSIRGGANRKVLERIKASGDIFMAWDDRNWVLDGANVRISIIGFDKGAEDEKALNGVKVDYINPDLTTAINLSVIKRLTENLGLAHEGTKKGADFDISDEIAQSMLREPINPNGCLNSDVIKPWLSGTEVSKRSRNMWIIDFGVNTSEDEASLYKKPFAYVEQFIKPKYAQSRKFWWLHERTRPEMRNALSLLSRFIATTRHSKYRLFVWSRKGVLPDSALVVFARDDDYFFGVLHSKPHELWALRLGTALGPTPRYTPTTTFETFPFPWPPGTEPSEDASPIVKELADATRELVRLRDAWLNPEGASEAEVKQRTLTNLYNKRPDWLDTIHQRLDAAVFAAYGWSRDLSDEQILERLLALNVARAQGQGVVVDGGEAEGDEVS